MRVSAKVGYALRALVEPAAAEPGRPVTAGQHVRRTSLADLARGLVERSRLGE